MHLVFAVPRVGEPQFSTWPLIFQYHVVPYGGLSSIPTGQRRKLQAWGGLGFRTCTVPFPAHSMEQGSHKASPDAREQGSRLHLWMGGATKSHCKGVSTLEGEELVATKQFSTACMISPGHLLNKTRGGAAPNWWRLMDRHTAHPWLQVSVPSS